MKLFIRENFIFVSHIHINCTATNYYYIADEVDVANGYFVLEFCLALPFSLTMSLSAIAAVAFGCALVLASFVANAANADADDVGRELAAEY